MNISYNWLKTYIPELDRIDIKELAHRVSGALAEVEAIIPRGHDLSNIVVGEITEVQNHPNNPKLMVAKVNIGKPKDITVLFAAENSDLVSKGVYYPVCLPGGTMYNSSEQFGKQSIVSIDEKDMDGITSEGVLCSPKELGVFDEKRGLSILGGINTPGTDLTSILKDYILEIENKSLTHRPDCFSHRGIAREIAVIMGITFMDKEEAIMPIQSGDKPINVQIKEESICQRFTSISMENIQVESSPIWVQVRLAYSGIRPINNIVDISNYVMMDIGYPIHIYDYDKLEEGELTVRKANTDEKFMALNENSYKLNSDMIVVSSGNIVEDLAGIMGGANSEISKNTKNIVIESASWDMFSIRRSSMTVGINTEASTRFSKGLDSEGTLETVKRVAMMIEELTGGEVASKLVDIKKFEYAPKTIQFNLKNVKRLLGVDIGKDKIFDILEGLGITIVGGEEVVTPSSDLDAILNLHIPSHRKDLNIQEDIVEEIARIYGYSNFTASYPNKTIQRAHINPYMVFGRKMTELLTKSGLDEIKSYSFVSEELYKKSLLNPNSIVKIKNPLSPELGLLRDSLIPSLVDKAILNLKNFSEFGLFEISRVTEKNMDSIGLNNQPYKISGIYVNKFEHDSFEILKSKVGFVLDNLNIPYKLAKSKDINMIHHSDIYHPNKIVVFESNNQQVATVGELHPTVKSNFEINKLDFSIFDINYDIVKNLFEQNIAQYRAFSQFPFTKRDINIWLNDRSEIGTIIDEIMSQSFNYLTNIELIDRYNENNKQSITLRFILGKSDSTISEQEVMDTIEEIKSFIQSKLKLQLRS